VQGKSENNSRQLFSSELYCKCQLSQKFQEEEKTHSLNPFQDA
jgi:hypothetical protein